MGQDGLFAHNLAYLIGQMAGIERGRVVISRPGGKSRAQTPPRSLPIQMNGILFEPFDYIGAIELPRHAFVSVGSALVRATASNICVDGGKRHT